MPTPPPAPCPLCALPPEERAALEALAARLGLPLAEALRLALEALVEAGPGAGEN